MHYTVKRQVSFIETILVEAPNEKEARAKAKANDGKVYDRKPGKMRGAVVVSQPDLTPVEGEELFTVEVNERHKTHHLIVAKDPKDAVMKVREGAGDCLHETEYVETLDSSNWDVRDSKGEWVF